MSTVQSIFMSDSVIFLGFCLWHIVVGKLKIIVQCKVVSVIVMLW